ncbi:acetyl-L-homoserine sulfhydrolase [Candidatus Marinamargulisbacteria bacterium SCGC AAA071-K20]|nr:acetyl-L-homoserine sulfhydrolase [Candidatus Marinamargulisbacteria bacterium SCGC AAA071-K20]
MKNWKFETKAIHGGTPIEKSTGATKTPVYQSTAFAAETAKDLEAIFKGNKYGFYYTRSANPTVAALESRVSQLESGVGAVAVASGMAAITTLIFSLATSGDHIIVSKSLFGSTYYLINGLIKNSGIEATFVDTLSIDSYKDAIKDNTRLIFIEAVGNPKLDVPDISAISQVARKAKIPFAVDNTFVSPYLLDAKALGADIVVTASTKYLCGGNSAVGGLVIDLGRFNWASHGSVPITELKKFGDQAFLAAAKKVRGNSGNALSPQNAFLTLTGIETLHLRVERHSENALAVATFLKTHPKVSSVTYPGLPDHPTATNVKKQLPKGCAGMLSFRVGSQENAYAFIDATKLADNSVNLGDTRTMVVHPGETIYRNLSAQEKDDAGVYADLVRVSVGIENSDDIIADFEQALGEV